MNYPFLFTCFTGTFSSVSCWSLYKPNIKELRRNRVLSIHTKPGRRGHINPVKKNCTGTGDFVNLPKTNIS
ncbi:MAG: hypothetical protein B6D45_05780 [Ignavibacteriales bacterium UTCHB3]|nr:MAG: hypothetical protein B6D45_05780 [Ignavibacteriales bacterium UTCHB3]